MALHSAIRGKLIAVIGDEDTCVGFLLGGIGEINKNRHPNFMVVDKNTAVSEIEDCFKRFVKRDDIDIILINQNIAEVIRHAIDSHSQPIPSVLEIPSKDHPYDASKDSILRRAKGGNIAADVAEGGVSVNIWANKPYKFGIKVWAAVDTEYKYFLNGFPHLRKDQNPFEWAKRTRTREHGVLSLLEPYFKMRRKGMFNPEEMA